VSTKVLYRTPTFFMLTPSLAASSNRSMASLYLDSYIPCPKSRGVHATGYRSVPGNFNFACRKRRNSQRSSFTSPSRSTTHNSLQSILVSPQSLPSTAVGFLLHNQCPTSDICHGGRALNNSRCKWLNIHAQRASGNKEEASTRLVSLHHDSL